MYAKTTFILLASTLISTAFAVPLSSSSSSSLTARKTDYDRSGNTPVFLYDGDSIRWHYLVIIPKDGTTTTSGYDAAGNCGGGFLDNLHGQSLDITQWGCNYGWAQTAADSATAIFYTPVLTSEQVHDAYNAATGGLNLKCIGIGGAAFAEVLTGA